MLPATLNMEILVINNRQEFRISKRAGRLNCAFLSFFIFSGFNKYVYKSGASFFDVSLSLYLL